MKRKIVVFVIMTQFLTRVFFVLDGIFIKPVDAVSNLVTCCFKQYLF